MKTYAHLDGAAGDAVRTIREIIALPADPETGDYPEPGKDLYTPAFALDLVEITGAEPMPAACWTTRDGGEMFAAPAAAPAPDLSAVRDALRADIDRQAEAQRALYVTDGSGQAMVYLQKQTQAAQALAGLAASPAMTADQGGAAFVLLAAEVGITVDPSSGAAAADVFGVARAVAATVQRWLPIAAAIEGVRLAAKRAIGAAATVADAQAVHGAVAWPKAG